MGSSLSRTAVFTDLSVQYWTMLGTEERNKAACACRAFARVEEHVRRQQLEGLYNNDDTVFPSEPHDAFPVYSIVARNRPQWSIYMRLNKKQNYVYTIASTDGFAFCYDRNGEKSYKHALCMYGYVFEQRETMSLDVSNIVDDHYGLFSMAFSDPTTSPYDVSRIMRYDNFVKRFWHHLYGRAAHIVSAEDRDRLEQDSVSSDDPVLSQTIDRIKYFVWLLYHIASLRRDALIEWISGLESRCLGNCCRRSDVAARFDCYYGQYGILWTSDIPDRWLFVRDTMERLPQPPHLSYRLPVQRNRTRSFVTTAYKAIPAPSLDEMRSTMETRTASTAPTFKPFFVYD